MVGEFGFTSEFLLHIFLVSAGFTDTEDIYDIADEGVLWLGREVGG